MNGSDEGEGSSDGSKSTETVDEDTPSNKKAIDSAVLVGILLPPLVVVLAFILEGIFGRGFLPGVVFITSPYVAYLISIFAVRNDIRQAETGLIQRIGYLTIGVHVLAILTLSHAFSLGGFAFVILAIIYAPIWILSALTPVSYVIIRVALSRRAQENSLEPLETDKATGEDSDDSGPSDLWLVGIFSPVIVSMLIHVPVGLPRDIILDLIPIIYLISLLSLIAHARNLQSTRRVTVAGVAGLLLALVTVQTLIMGDFYSDTILDSISNYDTFSVIWVILIHLSSASVIAYCLESRTVYLNKLWSQVTSKKD